MTLSVLKQRRRKALLDQGLKRCSKCSQIKSMFQFTVKQSKSDGLSSQCKCCQAEYRDWYRNNPENVARDRATSNAWKRRNKEHCRQYMKKWIKDNRDLMRMLRHNWHIANKEQENAKSRIRTRGWQEANPDHYHALQRLRRIREANAEGSHTHNQWSQLLSFFNGTCPRCGEEAELTQDHIIPLDWGGSNYLANLQPLCKKCILKKVISSPPTTAPPTSAPGPTYRATRNWRPVYNGNWHRLRCVLRKWQRD